LKNLKKVSAKDKKLNNLIVGIDFSDYSKLVVKEAIQLAEHLDLPLVFVHSYQDGKLHKYYSKPDLYHLVDVLQTKARRYYQIDDSQKIFIRFGRPDKEIIAVGKKFKNPMIIVGHKSGHAIAKFFLGSVAENLASTSPFPIWIHRGNKIILPKKILIPSDLSERSRTTINEVKNLETTFQSQFEICHVLPHPSPLLDYKLWTAMNSEMRKDDEKKIRAFKRKFPNLKTVRARGPIIDTINERSKIFDLIAITPHRRSKARNAFQGISSKIVHSGETPVLIVP
jgi:nucleotide-binding universal stress UspA family protein